MLNVLVLYHEDVSLRFPEHYRLPFLKYLPENNVDVKMIAFDSTVSELVSNEKLVRIKRNKANSFIEIPNEILSTTRSLNKAVQHVLKDGFTPDVVLTFNHPLLIRKGQSIANIYAAKHVVHIGHLMAESLIRNGRIVDIIRGLLGYALRKHQLAKCDQVLAMSPKMKSYLSQSLNSNCIKVWPSAVSTDKLPVEFQSNIREELGLSEDDLVVTYIGTLSKNRDLAFVLDSFKLVLYKHPKTKLIFFGYSPKTQDQESLLSYAKFIGILDNVVFHPPVPEEQLPYFIACADIGISPFKPTFVLSHNSPLKILEYMKAGVPVVATSIPDQEYIMKESNCGRLVGWDIEEHALAICELIEVGDTERKILGMKGYEWVNKERNIKTITSNLLDWLSNS